MKKYFFACVLLFLGFLFGYDDGDLTKLQENLDDNSDCKSLQNSFDKLMMSWLEEDQNAIWPKADELYGSCIQKLNDFPWKEYENLTAEEWMNLSPRQNASLDRMTIFFNIVILGALADNVHAQKYRDSLFANKDRSANDRNLFQKWQESTEIYEFRKASASAGKIINSAGAKEYLLRVIREKLYLSNLVSKCFLSSVSETGDFFPLHSFSAEQIQEITGMLEKQFDGLPVDEDSRHSRRWPGQYVFIKLYSAISPPEQKKKWLGEIQRSATLSKRSRTLVQNVLSAAE